MVYSGIIEGAKEVMHHHQKLNKINVFPVPDGDTGSNLFSTMNSIVRNAELKPSLKNTFESIADSAIIGARGNSGIIFAQFFQGISDSINADEMTPELLIEASGNGVKYAYDAVEVPVEGTVLTIMKVFHEAMDEFYHGNIEETLEKAYHLVADAVEKTTQQLKVLRKSGVVDSGAKGFQYFIKGFIQGLKGLRQEMVEEEQPTIIEVHDHDISYRYCTEALIENIEGDLKALLHDLGDSLIVAGNERKGRIHIHTDQPQIVFDRLSKVGKIIEQKVDDMMMQNSIVHERKHDRVIVTDSIADLPQHIIDNEQIHVLSLSILVDQVSYIDKLTITNEKILSLSHLKPTSSMPTRKQVSYIYDYLSNYYEEIIVITVSKALSGTYQAFLKESDAYDNVHVIDSTQNSVSQGLLVYQASEYLNEDLDTKALVDQLKEDCMNAKIIVNVENIDAMVASGRLPEKVGFMIERMGLKPIVTLSKGKGHIFGGAFGSKRSMNKVIKHMKKIQMKSGFKHVAITYVDHKEKAMLLKKRLEKLQIKVDYVVKSSAIIANGAGSGAVAVGYIKER